MKTYLDHIVISTKNLSKSSSFYQVFLGKPKITKWDHFWQLGEVKLFLTKPYQKKPRNFDKSNLGLNHIAFGIKSLAELKKFEKKLNENKIENSGIKKDRYSKKQFLWFDDPDGIRLEFYFR